MVSGIIFMFLFLLHSLQQQSSVLAQSTTPPVLTSICSGVFSVCAVFDYSIIKCAGMKKTWGSSLTNTDYLGDEVNEVGTRLPLINVGTNANITQISCGGIHVCFKFDNGDMKCLGDNTNGEIGIGAPSSTSPVGNATGYSGDALPFVDLGSANKVLFISAGASFNCVMLTGNKVKCFGNGFQGSLGSGNRQSIGFSLSEMGDNLPFIDFGTNVEVASLHSYRDAEHNCVILSAPAGLIQRVKCWGRNDYYQLGYGDNNGRGDDSGEMGDSLGLVDFGIESKVKQLTLGGVHTCALLVSNALKCFGKGEFGQLGSGSTSTISSTGDSLPAVLIDSGKTIGIVSNGNMHTCIIYDDMVTMKCFGLNYGGALGVGDGLDRGNTPTTMVPSIPAVNLGTGTLQIASVHIGGTQNCVVFVDNSIKCFGSNSFGQLAIGSRRDVGYSPNDMGSNLKSPMFLSTPCDFPKQKECSKSSQCVWVQNGKTGDCFLFLCSLIADGKVCVKDTRCSWVKNGKKRQCFDFDCSYITKKRACKGDSRCSWSNGFCINK